MNIGTPDATRTTSRGPVARQPRRSLTLFERMGDQYWRIARRRHVLHWISRIFRDDLTIYPLQYEETIRHLIALRRAVRLAQEFYRGLDPESMKRIQPWGTIAKLTDFESQVTELLLCVAAMQEASAQEHVFLRVQMHVVIRQLFTSCLPAFDDLISQLCALPEKVRETAERIPGEQP